jgi:hypothetical protein
VWAVLNRLLGRSSTNCFPAHSDSLVLANEFNSFFLAKSASLHASIMCSPILSVAVASNRSSPPAQTSNSGSSLNSFCHVSPGVIRRILLKSPRKSSIADPAPTWFLLQFLDILLPVITRIVNLAILEGMPDVFKESIVSPLLKKSNLDKDQLANFRPVSNLPFLSKVIERAIAEQLSDHLEKNNHYDPHQSAYRHHHSCEAALSVVVDSALTAMDNKEVTLLLLLDLSAAFDSVDHPTAHNMWHL